MQQAFRRWILFVLAGGGVLALDQGVKQLVTNGLEPGETWQAFAPLGGFIRITYSYNMGAAFGMFPFAADFILVLALVTVVAFIFSYPRLPANAWLSRLSIAIISGGALSNAIDRIRLGHVVDYVHVQLTPTFSNISNFADHAITIGVCILLFDQWRTERRETHERQAMIARAEAATLAFALAPEAPLDGETWRPVEQVGGGPQPVEPPAPGEDDSPEVNGGSG
jgi:signal peptidase II